MTVIKVIEKPKLSNALLIEGLPGVGNIGRVAVGYLVEELGAKKFAELYSEWFFPFVMLHENYKVHLLKNEFYYCKAKKKGQRDLVFLVGDCQSLTPQGHYLVAEKILDFAESVGVTDIMTIGGLATGEVAEETKKGVIGAVTDKGYGIDFNAGEKVGYIVGAAGLLLGLWKERDKDGICLLGQTTGFPIVTDPKAAEQVLDIVTRMLKLDIDMTKLEKKVKEMEDFIKKVEALQKRALMDITRSTQQKGKGEELRYIG
jgi:uncharacterized protein (TIGR00162 family)